MSETLTLPFDRLIADRAFAAGWCAKRDER